MQTAGSYFFDGKRSHAADTCRCAKPDPVAAAVLAVLRKTAGEQIIKRDDVENIPSAGAALLELNRAGLIYRTPHGWIAKVTQGSIKHYQRTVRVLSDQIRLRDLRDASGAPPKNGVSVERLQKQVADLEAKNLALIDRLMAAERKASGLERQNKEQHAGLLRQRDEIAALKSRRTRKSKQATAKV